MIGLIILCGLGILAMVSQILKFRQFLFPLVVIGLAATLGAFYMEWTEPFRSTYFNNMIWFDKTSIALSGVIVFTALLWILLANEYFNEGNYAVDHYALILFALVGAVMLTACVNMTTLFLGIEILSIPMYVLAASKKQDTRSNEAGFKYLIMGSFASGFLLFGIALVYGATGSFDFQAVHNFAFLNSETAPNFFYVGVVMILFALAFKVSVAPFHFWAPDVYEGSPVLVTALMSTVVKTAAFAAFMRMFMMCFATLNPVWDMIVVILVALSLVVSNFSALLQTNAKRMLAYSSISHAAFMLMIILANRGEMSSFSSMIFYTLAYSVSSILAFAVIYLVSKNGSEDLTSLNGLNQRNPLLAFGLTIALLSMAGIPLTSGFFSKYFVLSNMAGTDHVWLIVLAVISSAVAAFYYLRIIGSMYLKEGHESTGNLEVNGIYKAVILVCILLVFTLGILPGLVADINLF